MDPATTPFERALHLLLFVSAAVGIGVVAIAALERLTEGSRRTVRFVHILVVGVVVLAFFIGERVYHAAH